MMVNDSSALENEADVMGAKAINKSISPNTSALQRKSAFMLPQDTYETTTLQRRERETERMGKIFPR